MLLKWPSNYFHAYVKSLGSLCITFHIIWGMCDKEVSLLYVINSSIYTLSESK